ncbi:hypothetical protein [Burkholderia pseudomallei]|nr:hypothetical protein [Burkholderia pseudomallei]
MEKLRLDAVVDQCPPVRYRDARAAAWLAAIAHRPMRPALPREARFTDERRSPARGMPPEPAMPAIARSQPFG